MFYKPGTLIFILIVQIQVYQCDLETSNNCDASMCVVIRKKLNCSSENIPWECLNVKKTAVFYLYLENNKITDLRSDIFEGLENLQELHLMNNSIKYLHVNTFKNLSHLISIDLEVNQLIKISSGTFVYCNNLMQLYLRENCIKEIEEDSFKKNSTLIHFFAAKNKISDLKFLKNLPMLIYLDLSENDIKYIPANTLLQMKLLKQLNLSYNKLESLYSGTFSDLPALQTLNLSYNKLKHLGEGPFDHVPKLKDLDLRNNYLKEFSYIGFEKRSDLSIRIDKNYWRCEFIHQLLRLQINLRKYHADKNSSNVEGIPCEDKPTESTTSTTTTPASTTTTTSTSSTTSSSTSRTSTTVVKRQSLNSSTKLNTIARKLISINITVPSTTIIAVPLDEAVPKYITIPEIKINVSLIIILSMIGIAIVIVIIVIVVFSLKIGRGRSTYCNTSYPSDTDLTKDGYMRPRPSPPRASNFYVTLESYNIYEEVDLAEEEKEEEPVYETITEL